MKRLLLETSFSKIYMIVMILITLLIIGGYFSYALFTVTKEKNNAISIVTGSLDYKLTVDGEEKSEITINANTTKVFTVTLTNINEIEARFLVFYKSLPNGIDISYKKVDDYDIPIKDGTIIDNSEKEIYQIEIRNVTDEIKKVNIGVKVGLSWNELILNDGEYPFGERKEIEYVYTGNVQQYIVETSGIYTLETWGGQGGSVTNYKGGLGGYSFEQIYLEKGQILYVVVGGAGIGAKEKGEALAGGYNGGGSVVGNDLVNHINGSGGGATHIALQDGLLYTLENNKDSVLIVSGGGGGAQDQPNHFDYAIGARWGHGGSGGGTLGGGPFSSYGQDIDDNELVEITFALSTQETGFTFGMGQSVNKSCNRGAGGGGWYGGYNGCAHESLGQILATGSAYGGSGYVKEKNGYMKNGIREGNGYVKITQFIVS